MGYHEHAELGSWTPFERSFCSILGHPNPPNWRKSVAKSVQKTLQTDTPKGGLSTKMCFQPTLPLPCLSPAQASLPFPPFPGPPFPFPCYGHPPLQRVSVGSPESRARPRSEDSVRRHTAPKGGMCFELAPFSFPLSSFPLPWPLSKTNLDRGG